MSITLNQDWQNVAYYVWQPGTGFKCTFYVDAKYSTQSIANNTTTIQTRLNCVINQGSGSGANYQFGCSYAPQVSGSSVYQLKTETITSGESTITHESDGSKTLTIWGAAKVSAIGLDSYFSADVILPKINRYPVLSSGSDFTDSTNPVYTITAYGTYPLRVKLEAGGNTQLIIRDLSSKNSQTYTLELTNQERKTLRNLSPDGKTLAVRETVCAMSGTTELSSSYKAYTMTIVKKPARLRINGEFVNGYPYVRVSGEWKEAKPYIRVNSEWKEEI